MESIPNLEVYIALLVQLLGVRPNTSILRLHNRLVRYVADSDWVASTQECLAVFKVQYIYI